MNLQSMQAELKKLERRKQQLEVRLQARASKHYKSLPAKVGLRSVDELILSLAPYASSRFKGLLRANGAARTVAPASTKEAAISKPDRRRRYTAAQKAAVRAAIEKGGRTVGEVARDLNVSQYTIIDWKKQWGLTRKRTKSAAKKK